jgi:hypothetical protein
VLDSQQVISLADSTITGEPTCGLLLLAVFLHLLTSPMTTVAISLEVCCLLVCPPSHVTLLSGDAQCLIYSGNFLDELRDYEDETWVSFLGIGYNWNRAANWERYRQAQAYYELTQRLTGGVCPVIPNAERAWADGPAQKCRLSSLDFTVICRTWFQVQVCTAVTHFDI